MNRAGFLDGPASSYSISFTAIAWTLESKTMNNIFVELLHCTLKKVNPWADSTLCKNQEPTDWYTQKEVAMTLINTPPDQEVTMHLN